MSGHRHKSLSAVSRSTLAAAMKIFLCLLFTTVLGNEFVAKMEFPQHGKTTLSRDRLLFDYLMKRLEGEQKPTRLTAFQFTNCGDPATETVLLNQLNISPDPLPTAGTITVDFQGSVKQQVASPVKGDLTLKKEVFGVWVTVPCIDNIGSCSYDDICQILEQIPSCPEPFIQYNVPCHCPLTPGNYTLPDSSLQVNLGALPSGGYSARLDMTSATESVGCYEVQFTLS